MYRTLSIFITFLLPYLTYGQQLDHVLGDVIVELEEGYTPNDIFKQSGTIALRAVPNEYRRVTHSDFNIWLIHIDPNTTNEYDFLQEVKQKPFVLHAQKNHITPLRKIPNDEKFELQWQYINDGSNGGLADADLDIDLAWEVTTGGVTADGDTIVVCVIDDGANIEHPDLKENIWINYHEIPDNGIDDDNNGYIDDYHGWNAYNGNDKFDDGSHGTPVAGIIGAKGNNEIGVTGINWDTKVIIVAGGSPESTAIAAYGYAYTQRKRYNESNGAKGAFVVATNSSWGIDDTKAEDAPIWCDFYDRLGEVGILNCAATTNSNTNVDEKGDLPSDCSSDYLISVTNIARNDQKVTAGYGKKLVDLGAYGEQVFTLSKTDYKAFGGTSASTPSVAGVIGLVYSVDCPSFIREVKMTPAKAALAVKDFLLFGVKPNASLQDITVTGGRLNANNAVQNLVQYCDQSCTDVYGLHMQEIDVLKAFAEYFPKNDTKNITLRYRKEGTDQWTITSSRDTKIQLTNLEGCTTYEYQSRIECANDSPYSYTKRFTTYGCCEAPKITDISLRDDKAYISWESVIGASAYILQYNPEGSIWISKRIAASDTSFVLSDVQNCNTIDIRIKTECDITSRESSYTEQSVTGTCGACTKDYCSIRPKDTSDEWIESVSIDSVFTNVSGNNKGKGVFLGDYDISLHSSKDYILRLAPGFTTTGFAEFFRVYIDYDQDAIFDEEELIYKSAAVNTPVIDTFSIPETAQKGTTRMRVIMRFANEVKDGCDDDTWAYGEYEDYCVTILNKTSTTPADNGQMSIYPTPSYTSLYIDNPSAILIATVRLYDVQGRLVYNDPINASDNKIEVTGSEHLPKGVYFVQLSTKNKSTVHKWIKL